MKKYPSGILLLCLYLTVMQGCVQQHKAPLIPTFETLQSENIHVDVTPDAPSRVYVSLRDTTDKVFGLRKLAEQRIADMGYEITNNPSRAGYILQIDVLAVGLADAQAVRQAVPLGYGGALNLPPDLHRPDASVLVADVLLALRNKPQALKKRSHVLRAASSRSAVASYQMRVAVISNTTSKTTEADITYYEEALVKAIGDIFPPPPVREK